MRILAIRIKNLASLDGNTEIDFSQEPLCSAGIFAITGPTGAGKSTILDALCLALYAKTPRYRLAEYGIEIMDVKGSTIKQDDVRGVLRDGTFEGFAEVDFVGIDGQHYRANWSVRRAYNKAEGTLRAYEMTLKNISTNQDVPGKKAELLNEIERLVGLNFEQFTRSVLLAQGDFTAFLKAGKDEKSSLLEKLTGTYIYSEISRRIFENHKEQQQKLRELNLQCEGIATLTAEELADLQGQKAGLEIAIKSNEQHIVDLNKEIVWHEQLVKLQEGVTSANLQYEQASVVKTEAFLREQQLQQIIRIQPVRPVIGELQNTQDQLTSKSKQLEDLVRKMATLQQEKVTLDTMRKKSANELDMKTEEEEHAQPLLNTAKALDVQLADKAEQIKLATEESGNIHIKQEQQAEQLLQGQKELDLLEQEITKLNQWKAGNEFRRPIAEQENLILSKLQDAVTILEGLNSLALGIRQAEQETEKHEQQKRLLETEQGSVQNQLEQVQNDYNTLQKALSAIPLQDVEKEKSAIDNSVEDMISAAAHWQLLYQAIRERDTLQQLLEHNKQELQQQTEKLIEAGRVLEIRKVERDISLNSLEKAKLVSAESIERLRNQLEPEEPCPVCGSKEHPYAIHHPVLDLVLAEMESTYQLAEVNYTQHLTSHSGLHQLCIQLDQNIPIQESDFSLKSEAILDLEKTWSSFQVYEKCEELPIQKRTDWLQQKLKEQRERQYQLQEQIQSHDRQRQQFEDFNTQLADYNQQLNTTGNQIKDIDRIIKSLHEKKINYASELDKANSRLNTVKQALTVYFISEQWFQNWHDDPENFTRDITGFALEWKTTIEKLEGSIRQQTVLAEKLNGMKELSTSIGEEVKLKEQKLSALQLQWNDLSDRRSAIFNGGPVTEIETNLKNAVILARQVLEGKKQEIEQLQNTITRNAAQYEQIGQDKLILSAEKDKLKMELDEWLSRHNQQYRMVLTELELFSLLAFTQDWIETERATLLAIDNSVIQAKSVSDERIKALENHIRQRLSEKTLDELIALQTEAQVIFKQNNQKANEIDFKIKENDANKQRIGHLLQDVGKLALIVDNWAKLNDIIGSADGKKFRQFAQEYTLDVLLGYANVHLEVLSKRYVLQRIPNSLGLQVIDQDMGDEVRAVHSLSGGESFLVSLALALGLASLSSSRMKVESLFIDEGFGSLDPATLNIAMDALERLHNQGRKVGVISHVQELTERIPVQIVVNKQHSGKSKVEVIGI